MASRPAELPQWGDDVDADIVKPTSGKLGLGWKRKERPPGQYLNWYQNLVYQWLQYLDDPGSKTLTLNAFASGVCDAAWTRERTGGEPGWAECTVGGGGIYSITAPILTGCILTAVQYQLWGDGVADVTVNIYRMDGTSTGPTATDTATYSNEAAAWVSRSITLAAPSALSTQESYVVDFVANDAGIRINNVRFVYSHAGSTP